MARFSKSTMVSHLEAKIAAFEGKWKFDPNNGSSQLREKSEEAWEAYGAYQMCQRLITEIDEGRVE